MKKYLIQGLLLAGALCSASSIVQAAALNDKTYWFGNTWGEANELRFPASIADIYVRPNGTIFTNAYWDEGGKEALVFNTKGIQVARLESTHGHGGFAVTADATYVYVAARKRNGRGNENKSLIHVVRRYKHDGTLINWNSDQAPITVNELTTRNDEFSISGLAVFGNNLYVANPKTKKIHVYNKNNRAVIRSFALNPNGSIPYKIDVDASGFLWVVQKLTNGTYRIRKYNANGIYQNKQITTIVEPTDVAIGHKTGYLFVTDNGPEQCGFVYDVSGTPKFIRRIGERKGVFAGTRPGSAIAGRKMFGPSGIGEGANGRVYTSSTGVGNPLQATSGPGKILFDGRLLNGVGLGATLKRFPSDGKFANYTRIGLEFLDTADAQPNNPRFVYTKDSKYSIDYAKSPGNGWRHQAWTIDPFKYPNDPRIALKSNTSAGVHMIRVNKQGVVRNFKAIHSQGAPYLAIYRFDGNIAVPAFIYSLRGTNHKSQHNKDWPPNAPTSIEDKSWFWNDDDGDGQMDANEYATFDNFRLQNTWASHVDEAGTIWLGEENNKKIHRLVMQSISSKGVPIYNTLETVDLDDLVGGINQLERFYYDNATDRAFIGCYTNNDPKQSFTTFGHVGTRLKRLDNWSKAFDDNASTNPNQVWEKDLVYTADSRLRCMAVEKDYIFLGSSQTNAPNRGRIEVRKVSDGSKVGDLKIGPEVGGADSGRIDMQRGVNAHRKDDGTYVIFAQENKNSRVLFYQWKP